MASGSKKINNVKSLQTDGETDAGKNDLKSLLEFVLESETFQGKVAILVLLGEVSVTSQLSMGSIYICII